MSYSTDCENCEDKISAAYRYCPYCGVAQQRAAEAIEGMRAAKQTAQTGR